MMKIFFANGFFSMKLDFLGRLYRCFHYINLHKSWYSISFGNLKCRVRIWDLAIFFPNFFFFLFMLVRFNRARLKLRATSSPIFATFYSLVLYLILIFSHYFIITHLLLLTGGAQCSDKSNSLHSINDCECLLSCRRLCRQSTVDNSKIFPSFY